MQLTDNLSSDSISLDVECKSKKQLFQHLADLACKATDIDSSEIFEALSEREKLGCTALEGGVAIPHGHVDGCCECHLFFVRLTQPMAFESDDEQNTDLVFCVLGCPEAKNEPVKIISRISKVASDEKICAELRQATTVEEIRNALSNNRFLKAA